MKKIGILSIACIFMPTLFLLDGFAQDYTQWHLPEGATSRLGKGSINDAKFSPDGTRLAVATSIGVWIYDTHTGAEIALLNEEPRNIATIAFSPDSKTLASGARPGNRPVQVWDTTTGKELSTMDGDIDWVRSLGFSADGKTLAGAGVGAQFRGAAQFWFYVWDVSTGREVSNFPWHQDRIHGEALVVSPNHRFVASAGRNTVFLWDTRTGNLTHTIESDIDEVWSLAFSPDGKTLAGGHTTIRLWDVETGDPMFKLEGHTRTVTSLVFSPDGKILASGDTSGKIMLWAIDASGNKLTLRHLLRTITGEPLSNNRTFTEHKRPIEALAFTADGKTLVSASRDNTIRLWDVDTGNQHLMTKGHTEAINALGFLKDGKTLASGSFDCTLRLWDTETGNQQLIPVEHRWFAFSFAFSQDGKMVAIGSVGNDVQLWDAEKKLFRYACNSTQGLY